MVIKIRRCIQISPLLPCLLGLLLLLVAWGNGEEEIEYQNGIACDLDVCCPKGYGINAVYGKAGQLFDDTFFPVVPIPDTDDYEWFWNCEKASE